MQTGILYHIENIAARKKMIDNAFIYAKKKFLDNNTPKRIEDIYENIL